MNLIQRVQDILMKPKETWPEIAAEGGDAASIYRHYLVFLAAIPALAGFVGMSLTGFGGAAPNVRIPLANGFMQMIVSYALTLAMVFVLALIVDALAPTFGGTRSRINALKVVAYGSTASLLGGIVGLMPGFAILGVVASLYTLYLIFTGLPVLMKCPPDKAVAYTAVVTVCGIVAVMILSSISMLLLPSRIVQASDAAPRWLAVHEVAWVAGPWLRRRAA